MRDRDTLRGRRVRRLPGTEMGERPHMAALSAEGICGWCYVRLGRFGEIRMLRHEGVRPHASVYDLIYTHVEVAGRSDGMLCGATQFNERTVLSFSTSHSNDAASRLYLLLSDPIETPTERLYAAIVHEATTLLQLCDALPDNCVDGVPTRTIASVGMIQVDSDLHPIAAWFSEEPTASAHLPILRLQCGRLRPHIASLLSALTQAWDWGDATRCVRASGRIGNDIVMHAIPSSTHGAVTATLVFETFRSRRTLADTLATHAITTRESEVIRLLMAGHSVKEVAQTLCVEQCTIHDHIKNALAKTNARNRSHMIAMLLGYHADSKPEGPDRASRRA